MLFLLQSLTLGISSWNFQLETSYARIFRFIHMNILKVKLRLHHILFWYIRNCWASWWFGVLVTSSWCTPDLDAFRLMKFKWKFSVARLQVDTSGFHPREFFFALPCLVITPNFEFSSLNLVSEPSVNFVIFTFVNFWVSVNDQSVKSPISKCLAMSSIEYLQEVHWTLIDLPNQSLNSLTNPSLFPSLIYRWLRDRVRVRRRLCTHQMQAARHGHQRGSRRLRSILDRDLQSSGRAQLVRGLYIAQDPLRHTEQVSCFF